MANPHHLAIQCRQYTLQKISIVPSCTDPCAPKGSAGFRPLPPRRGCRSRSVPGPEATRYAAGEFPGPALALAQVPVGQSADVRWADLSFFKAREEKKYSSESAGAGRKSSFFHAREYRII